MAAKCEEFYCRRADRAPEKPEFFKLPTEDRQLICQLRSAINVAKDKVTVLRDESEDKERDLSREVALRKAAEQRLEQMVDMYGDPAVTEELRRRLPRAGKTDPKLRLQRELEELDHASSLHSTGPDGSKARRNLAAELEDQIITSGMSRKSRSLSADSLSRRSQDRDDRSRRNRSHSPPERSQDRSRDRSRDYNHYPSYPGGPYPGPYPGAAHPAFYPPMYTYPQPPIIYAATPGATPTPGVPLAHSTPAQIYMMAPPTATSTPAQSTVGQPVVVNPAQTQQTPPPQQGGVGTGGGVDSGVGVTSSVVCGATSVSDRSGVSNIKAVTVNREQQRQISMLLAELDASKDLNKQLQTKLTTSEKELGSLKLATQNQDATLNATESDRIAELVAEIRRAQKIRDESMLGRLRVANEDRDEALLKLKRLRISSQHGLDSEKDLLLGERTESWERLGEQLSGVGGDLVEKITSRRQRYTDINTEEMRAILQERDSVVDKCRQLEAEVVKLQRLNRVRGSDKQQYSTSQDKRPSRPMQAKLLATKQERDLALARVQKLEDELQTLRVYYSLHKSLSQEANLRDQFNNTLKNIEGAVKDRDSTIESSLHEKDQLMVQLKTVMAEKAALSEQLEKAQAGQKEAQANCHKLERLVNVLRRKINGLGSKMDDCC